jgi:hypothetical protein
VGGGEEELAGIWEWARPRGLCLIDL